LAVISALRAGIGWLPGIMKSHKWFHSIGLAQMVITVLITYEICLLRLRASKNLITLLVGEKIVNPPENPSGNEGKSGVRLGGIIKPFNFQNIAVQPRVGLKLLDLGTLKTDLIQKRLAKIPE
jgi:hypothetical protein